MKQPVALHQPNQGRMLEKFGVIADIHGYEEPLAMVLRQFSDMGIRAIACLGDIGSGGQALDRVVELLEAHSVQAVAGNHDRGFWNDQSLSPAVRDYLSGLPLSYNFVVRGKHYGCFHDNPLFKMNYGRAPFERSNGIRNDEQARFVLQRMAEHDYHAMFVGHIHRPRGWMWRRNVLTPLDATGPVALEPDATYLLAPGSVAEPKVLSPHAVAHPREDCDAHYGIFDAVNNVWTVKSFPLFRGGKPVFAVNPANRIDYI